MYGFGRIWTPLGFGNQISKYSCVFKNLYGFGTGSTVRPVVVRGRGGGGGDGVVDGYENYMTVSNDPDYPDYPSYSFKTECYWYEDLTDEGNEEGEDDTFISALDANSDGDGLSDGKEIFGYRVKIFMVNEEGKSKESFVYLGMREDSFTTLGVKGLDPTDPFNEHLDADGDKMTNYAEEHPYESYSTYISKRHLTEDDIKAQFNPFIKDNIPPIVYDIDVDTTADKDDLGRTTGYGVYVKGTAFDITGIQQVELKIKGGRREVIVPTDENGDPITP